MKQKPSFIFLLFFAWFQLLIINVSAQDQNNKEIKLQLQKDKLHDLSLEEPNTGEYKIATTGSDPYVFKERFGAVSYTHLTLPTT